MLPRRYRRCRPGGGGGRKPPAACWPRPRPSLPIAMMRAKSQRGRPLGHSRWLTPASAKGKRGDSGNLPQAVDVMLYSVVVTDPSTEHYWRPELDVPPTGKYRPSIPSGNRIIGRDNTVTSLTKNSAIKFIGPVLRLNTGINRIGAKLPAMCWLFGNTRDK